MTDRGALASIFCTATVDVLALGIVYPVLPMLLLGFSAGDTSPAAETLVLFTCTWGLMQFALNQSRCDQDNQSPPIYGDGSGAANPAIWA